MQPTTPMQHGAPLQPPGTKKIQSIHHYAAREADELAFSKFEELWVYPVPVEVWQYVTA
jgi:hypothetical protein